MRAQWLEAAAGLGLPVTDDFNGDHPEGFGCYQLTVRNGRRWSAADAFLRPALRRANVKLETQAWVRKIRCDGRRVVGVEYVRGDQPRYAGAEREVIVCAGAVNSPQLLQLSGIGPANVLVGSRHRRPARQPRRGRQSCRIIWPSCIRSRPRGRR